MKKFSPLLIIVLMLVISQSCSLDKRLYSRGYHVTWNKSHTVSKLNVVELEKSNDAQSGIKDDDVILGVDHQDETIVVLEKFENIKLDREVLINEKEEEKKSLYSDSKLINRVDESNIDVVNKVSSVEINLEKQTLETNENANKEESASGKSQVVALILVLLVGFLGIHRFYLGHVGIGILMLLTGGVCGILLIIDLIRIITGDLKPANGDYETKL